MSKDTIDRQAAIDAYGDWYVEEGMEHGFIGTVKQLLEGLPSAQPEIIRCKDCKFAINADTDMMCGNPKSWVVATENDFGCILAERREQ